MHGVAGSLGKLVGQRRGGKPGMGSHREDGYLFNGHAIDNTRRNEVSHLTSTASHN